MIKVDWIEGLNKSIEYIEENLTETIEMERRLSLRPAQCFSIKEYFLILQELQFLNISEEDV